MSALQVPIIDMLITSKVNRPYKKITPTYIVIHWTANEGKGADADANAKYFQRATRPASAHYCVDSEKVVRCIPSNEMAYHVGASKYTAFAKSIFGSASPNSKTIGIEMCVNSDGDFWKMYSNAVKLTADLLKQYGLGLDRIIRHYDVTGKNCPAFMVDDKYAMKYTGRSAKEAFEMFKKDVARFI